MAAVGGSQLLEEFQVQVLEIPPGMEDSDGTTPAQALVVLRRQNGVLLAVPIGVLAEEALAAGLNAAPEDPIGLSTTVSVPAGRVTDLDGAQQPDREESSFVDVLLVDVSMEMGQHIPPYSAVQHPLDILRAIHICCRCPRIWSG